VRDAGQWISNDEESYPEWYQSEEGYLDE